LVKPNVRKCPYLRSK